MGKVTHRTGQGRAERRSESEKEQIEANRKRKAAMKNLMVLAYHTKGIPYAAPGNGSCLDPLFTKGCTNKKHGFVTQHLHKNAVR